MRTVNEPSLNRETKDFAKFYRASRSSDIQQENERFQNKVQNHNE